MRQQVLAGALGFRRLKVVLKMLDAKMFEVGACCRYCVGLCARLPQAQQPSSCCQRS
jgi:hypothetical protein